MSLRQLSGFGVFNIIHFSLMLYYLPTHGLKVVVSISVLCVLPLYQRECRIPGRSELNDFVAFLLRPLN